MSILVATAIAAACFTVDLGVQSSSGECPEPITYEAPEPPPKSPVRMESMSWNTFTSIPNGTQVLNHGYDQCVALANKYHEEELGGNFVGVASAYQWWTEFESRPSLTSIYTKSSTPVPGAVFVSRGGGIYDEKHGHIGIVTSVNANGTFNTMEQNAGTWRHVGRYTRSMEAVYGFLVPKNNPANPQNTTVDVEEDELEMANQYIAKKVGAQQINGIFNTLSGFFHEFESANGDYNTNIAKTFGVKDPSSIVSTSHYDAVKRDCAVTRQGK